MGVWSLRISRKGKWLLEMRGSHLASTGTHILGILRVPGAAGRSLLLEPLVVCQGVGLGCWLRRCGGAVVGAVWAAKGWLRSFVVQVWCSTAAVSFL